MKNITLEMIIMGSLGVTAEVMFTSVFDYFSNKKKHLTGYSYPIMFPIYAAMAPMFEYIVPELNINNINVFSRAVVYAGLIMTGELISGYLLRIFFNEAPWEEHYKGKPDTIAGLTRLSYAPFWGLFGLGAELMHNSLTHLP
ncbi:hypothetical protein HYV79_00070 [Candidatus Woesearchaeota archaeon]|nr:hypothetical protein [Candidatus Woesearchaeota archaeon]